MSTKLENATNEELFAELRNREVDNYAMTLMREAIGWDGMASYLSATAATLNEEWENIGDGPEINSYRAKVSMATYVVSALAENIEASS